jgi:murein DD-endopeptidase MepM/ murein hydrolase activator NlpD
MKKTLLFLLIILPIFIILILYFISACTFACPIKYRNGIIVRSDARGDGFFGSERNGNRFHEGVDLLAEVGTPVLAAASGKVIAAKRTKGMGKFVIIRHPRGISTLYGHLSEICVRKGQFVRQGQIIGRVGKTGNANYRNIQPHLHFEVMKDRVPQDPLEYLE